MEIKIIGFILVGFLTIWATVMLMREYMAIKTKVDSLEERMKKLESANRQRMPYDAVDKLLNARAALNREKEERQLGISFLENAEAWLDQVMETGTKREEKK